MFVQSLPSRRNPVEYDSSKVRGYRLNTGDDVEVVYTPNKELYYRAVPTVPLEYINDDSRDRRMEARKKERNYKPRRVSFYCRILITVVGCSNLPSIRYQ